MYRNDEPKDKVHSCRQIFTQQGTNTGHVKFFFDCQATRDNLLFQGGVDIFNTELRVVEVDLNKQRGTVLLQLPRVWSCSGLL